MTYLLPQIAPWIDPTAPRLRRAGSGSLLDPDTKGSEANQVQGDTKWDGLRRCARNDAGRGIVPS